MLTGHSPDRSARVGLALAGGGPEGAVYEAGALRALDEALDGIDLNQLAVYVGVSAGAFIAANLANGITTAQNVRAMFKHEPDEHPFHPQTFFTPAVGEIVRRGLRTPELLLDALWAYFRDPADLTLAESMLRLAGALPVGLFDNEPIRAYLQKIYTRRDRTDDFRRLRRRLIIVATELDSGRAVRFGEPGHEDVPISSAVQASSALPGLYPPVLIDGRHYVDGVLLKTLHASVALDAGAELVVCVNPIVPVDTLQARDEPTRSRRLTDLGLPVVLSQTFRTLIHSRMTVGFAAYGPRFPGQDLVLVEPRSDDYRMFFTNIFSLSSRKAICEFAYKATRRELLRRYDEWAPVFARHGVRLRRDVLVDGRDLWSGIALDGGGSRAAVRPMTVAARLARALDQLEALLDRSPVAAGGRRRAGRRDRSRPRRRAPRAPVEVRRRDGAGT